jgi:inner membrane protease ATP23
MDKSPASPSEPERSGSSKTRSRSDLSAFEEWRTSLAHFTGLGLSPEEKAQREERIEQKRLESDWNRCEGWKTDLMKNSG